MPEKNKKKVPHRAVTQMNNQISGLRETLCCPLLSGTQLQLAVVCVTLKGEAVSQRSLIAITIRVSSVVMELVLSFYMI